MSKLVKIISKVLDGAIVFALAIMVIIVFLNVFFRYVLDSGLTWSEELARYLFVWVIFLGAIVALKDKSHLGIDLLVGALPKFLQKVFFLVSNIVIIVALLLFADGLVKMIALDKGILAPATGVPINMLPLAGLVAAVCMIIISVLQTTRFVFLDKDAPPWVKDKEDAEIEKGDYK